MPQSRTDQFDALVAPHMATLFRVAYRLVRNTPDAQDLVQDTCVTALEQPAMVDAATHPVRWLLRVLHNRFIDSSRRRQVVPFVALDEASNDGPLASHEPGPEELLQQEDDELAFVQAFLQLEPTQRTLLTLRAEGHDLAEIEAITGISREVLRARLHRARRTLAQRLNESGARLEPVRTGSHT
jgi:RNA polymerase sigma-70 factor (ECF subfamily)